MHAALTMTPVTEKSMKLDQMPNHSTPARSAQVVSLEVLTEPGNLDENAPVIGDGHPLHGIKAQVQVCVGQATVTVGELLGAREQQVLVLDRTPDQPVDLLLDGKVVARGQLVAVNGHFAVRITELPVSLKLKSKT